MEHISGAKAQTDKGGDIKIQLAEHIVTNRGVISKYNWQSIINLAALHASSDTCTYTAARDTQVYTEQ